MNKLVDCPRCGIPPSTMYRNLNSEANLEDQYGMVHAHAVFCPCCNLNFDRVYSPTPAAAAEGWNEWVVRFPSRARAVPRYKHESSGTAVLKRKFSFA